MLFFINMSYFWSGDNESSISLSSGMMEQRNLRLLKVSEGGSLSLSSFLQSLSFVTD
jgi:hypothetical protein